MKIKKIIFTLVTLLFFLLVLNNTQLFHADNKITTQELQYIDDDMSDIISFLEKDTYIYSLSEKHKLLFLQKNIYRYTDLDIATEIKNDINVFISKLGNSTIDATIKNISKKYLNDLFASADINENTPTLLDYMMQDSNYNKLANYYGSFKTHILEELLNTYVFNDSASSMIKEAQTSKNTANLDATVKELQVIADNSGYATGQICASIVDYYQSMYNQNFETDYTGFDRYFNIEKINFTTFNNISNVVNQKNEYQSFKNLYKQFYMMSSFEAFVNIDVSLMYQQLESLSRYQLKNSVNIELKKSFYNALINRIKYENKEITKEELKIYYDSFNSTYDKIDAYYLNIEKIYPQSSGYTVENLKTYNETLNKKYSYCYQNNSFVKIELTETIDTNSYNSIPMIESKNSMLFIYIFIGFIIISAITVIVVYINKKGEKNNYEYYY